jgi:hypothetical protein
VCFSVAFYEVPLHFEPQIHIPLQHWFDIHVEIVGGFFNGEGHHWYGHH